MSYHRLISYQQQVLDQVYPCATPSVRVRTATPSALQEWVHRIVTLARLA
jgi:hypothetical protein